jgi:hypothetical protein
MKYSEASKTAFRITMAFEGTDYIGLEGNFDGQGFTHGALGWCLGQGSLQKLLKEYQKADPELFKKCCTTYVKEYDKEMDLSPTLMKVSNMSPKEAVAWSELRQEKKVRANGKAYWEVAPHWVTVFKNIGSQPIFQAVQRKLADAVMTKALKYATEYGVRTNRGLAFFFDTCTQQGSVSLKSKAKIKLRRIGSMAYKDKLEALAKVMSEQAKREWAYDVYSRRKAIALGEGMAHGRYWHLDKDFGLSDEIIV